MWRWRLNYPFVNWIDEDRRLDIVDMFMWLNMYASWVLNIKFLPNYIVEQIPDDVC